MKGAEFSPELHEYSRILTSARALRVERRLCTGAVRVRVGETLATFGGEGYLLKRLFDRDENGPVTATPSDLATPYLVRDICGRTPLYTSSIVSNRSASASIEVYSSSVSPLTTSLTSIECSS